MFSVIDGINLLITCISRLIHATNLLMNFMNRLCVRLRFLFYVSLESELECVGPRRESKRQREIKRKRGRRSKLEDFHRSFSEFHNMSQCA